MKQITTEFTRVFAGILFFWAISHAPGQISVTPAELAEARQWAAAKFEGREPAKSVEPALIVLANHDPVQKNARGGRPMKILNTNYTRGLYCHAFSKIIVRLPGPGAVFSAVVGVDSNEQTSGGRGSIDFSVAVGAVEKFRSGIMREGIPGKLVQVDLGGATEFVIQVDETPDGIACDQADWAEAKVTLKDGSSM